MPKLVLASEVQASLDRPTRVGRHCRDSLPIPASESAGIAH